MMMSHTRMTHAIAILIASFSSLGWSQNTQITGNRQIEGSPVSPGGGIGVIVQIAVDETEIPNGLIVSETLPIGWIPSNASPSWSSFNMETGEIKWLFGVSVPVADREIAYDITVPNDAVLGTFTVSGVLKYNDSQGNPIENAVGGTDEVIVADDQQAQVPNVTGQSLTNARAILSGAGLTEGNEVEQCNNEIPAGNVISQNPVGGTEVAEGSSVDLVVSTGDCEPVTGTVSVNVTPNTASWTISGPSGFEGNGQNYFGDQTFIIAPAGLYTWIGNALSGYETPASQSQTLSAGGAISFNKTWTEMVEGEGEGVCDPPNTPTDVSASDGIYNDHIHITWNPSNGAESYQIYRGITGDSWLLLDEVDSNSYDDDSVEFEKNYKYSIVAFNSCGASGWSEVDAGCLFPCSEGEGQEECVSPETPENVSASDGSYTNRIRVTWNSANRADKYSIYRIVSGAGNWVWIADASSNSYDDFFVEPGSTYGYKVFSINLCGDVSMNSGFSGIDYGYIRWEEEGEGEGGCDIPDEPTGVSASNGTYYDHINIVWNYSNDVDYYQVLRIENNGEWYYSPIIYTNYYNDYDVEPGENYEYCVIAYNGCGSITSSTSYIGSLDKFLSFLGCGNVNAQNQGIWGDLLLLVFLVFGLLFLVVKHVGLVKRLRNTPS